jgi:hypothetical protein
VPSIIEQLRALLSPPQKEASPEVVKGTQVARKEQPDLGAVQPYGFVSRMMMPTAQAYTSPGRNIYLNSERNEGQSPEEIADTLAHEQTHVKQMQDRGLSPTMEFLNMLINGSEGEPYHRRPDEMEAFQVEQERRAKAGRSQTAIPKFTDGGYYTPDDVRLPNKSGQVDPTIVQRMMGKKK